jgi:hypothetical protein
MNLRPKNRPAVLAPKKTRRTSAEVAAEKEAKELAKEVKANAATAKVLAISRKENAMAAEDAIAIANANHPPVKTRTKVQRVKLVAEPKSMTAARQQEGKSLWTNIFTESLTMELRSRRGGYQ